MTEQDVELPFKREFNLGSINRDGADIVLDVSADDRERIAAWAGITAVASFIASIHLKKQSATRFSLQAELVASVEQACVVTLAPVRSTIEIPIHRELHLTQTRRHLKNIELNEGAGDDEVPDEIETLHYDLAEPLLEEFALALDPYPRAPGVEFAAPAEDEPKPASPFAVLKNLGKQT
jgi:hypothetical protein